MFQRLPTLREPLLCVFVHITFSEMYNRNMQLLSNEDYRNCRIAEADVVGNSLDGASFTDCSFDNIKLTHITLNKLFAKRTKFIGCDFSNLSFAQSVFADSTFCNCRLTGFKLAEAELADCTFKECKLDLAQFRFSRLRHIKFNSCELREADFYGATLSGVAFVGCSLEHAEFYKTKTKEVDFRTSKLCDLRFGVDDLRGVKVTSAQVVELLPSLSALAGFEVDA